MMCVRENQQDGDCRIIATLGIFCIFLVFFFLYYFRVTTATTPGKSSFKP